MNPILLLGILVWVYLLSVLRRTRLAAFYFIIGSIGLFFILIVMSKPYWVFLLTKAVLHGIGLFGDLTGFCHSFTKYGMLYIYNVNLPITISIDYECSGIIESCAFIALVAFYPVYSRKEKFFYALLGMIWIYLANVIRLMIVTLIIHFGGSTLFFLAHSIVGRVIFYILVITLYYNVFTYSQISNGLYHHVRKLFMKGARS